MAEPLLLPWVLKVSTRRSLCYGWWLAQLGSEVVVHSCSDIVSCSSNVVVRSRAWCMGLVLYIFLVHLMWHLVTLRQVDSSV